MENQDKASIHVESRILGMLDSYIGGLRLEAIHMGSLQSYIQMRRKGNVKSRTINYGLQVVRHILNLAAGEWLDDFGLTWLATAPKIKLLPEIDKRKPYPLTWTEQEQLFKVLPAHLKQMALFAVKTGCRDQEICNLRWEWEVQIDGGSVFIIPGEHVKNREDRLIVLNQIAQEVIEAQRGLHERYVFVFRNKPVTKILNTGWKKARQQTGLRQVRVHDLKHTFGRRLSEAGVSFEDRQDLLGHKSGRITTHYSSAELQNLIEAANKVCAINQENSAALTILRTSGIYSSRKSPANNSVIF